MLLLLLQLLADTILASSMIIPHVLNTYCNKLLSGYRPTRQTGTDAIAASAAATPLAALSQTPCMVAACIRLAIPGPARSRFHPHACTDQWTVERVSFHIQTSSRPVGSSSLAVSVTPAGSVAEEGTELRYGEAAK